MVSSVVGIVVTTPMFLSIICFEKNDLNRTLINQLVSSINWFAILWNITLQIPTVVRYLTGPFPEFLCFMDLLLRNMISMMGLLLLDFIIIVRYLTR